MKHISNIKILLAFLVVAAALQSCQQPKGEITGSEFMPDMAHSTAYEANTYSYYYNNTWGSEEEYYQYAMPKEPVSGTVPRGAAGLAYAQKGSKLHKSISGELTNASISIPVNGSVPYHYENTEADRLRAAQEVIQNPLPITDSGMKGAKELYNIYCGICHGDKGDGAGYLVREDGGKYPAQPANLLLESFVTMSNGQYYYTIMHGKNVMGGYADKLSYEERWEVIHYIRGLQAKELKKTYNEQENTLNDWATPAATIAQVIEDHGHDEMHGEDHGNHDDHDAHDSHGNDDQGHGDHH